ncbi:MAG TPA: ribbon-helix-helix domain-containing protein [Candidatus Fraserbacteria bacterium]|nr:ribbon-helix-helix domain-containing protein [Candidatus Fraserbacteria bacterium]
MRRVNWTITEGQHRALKKLSQQTGLSISELVRRAIDKYIGLLGEEPEPRAAAQLRPSEPRSEVPR